MGSLINELIVKRNYLNFPALYWLPIVQNSWKKARQIQNYKDLYCQYLADFALSFYEGSSVNLGRGPFGSMKRFRVIIGPKWRYYTIKSERAHTLMAKVFISFFLSLSYIDFLRAFDTQKSFVPEALK